MIRARLSLLLSLVLLAACGASNYAKPGFVTMRIDNRLWIFREDSPELAEFQETGEPSHCVTVTDVGPEGMTLRGPDHDTIHSYLCCREGFFVQALDGELWVFETESPELEAFLRGARPAEPATLENAGPRGLTLRGADEETLRRYLDAG